MAHDEQWDALQYLGWRFVALIGLLVAIAGMLSSTNIRDRRSARLRVPVAGIDAHRLTDSFDDPRSGDRLHEALDIPAPRGTLVVAATAGRVRRVFASPRGGLGVYQIDRAGARCLYYAHLDRYVRGLEEGQDLEAGDPIGYVGTTGNAAENVPHLHFALLSLTDTTRCSDGRPINPIGLFR